MVICKENSPCTRLQIKPTIGNTIFRKCSECCWDRKRKHPKEKTSGTRFERKSQTRQTAPSTAANYGVTRTLNNPNPTSGIYQSCLIFGEGKGERREKKQALLVLSAETLNPSTRIRVQMASKNHSGKNPFSPGKYLRHFSISILSTDCLLTAAELGPELHQADWSPAEGANGVAE